ncbi:MAG: PhzF family phenazine biosynthesis protein [Gemmatimonadetes bacterium]|nr:PhzF family phenazine biosynthesis protein [Gemmatimonadota bacterium]
MASLDLWLVDAFTEVPFEGNPAGVCFLDGPVPDRWMQSLAMELNQAETAFILKEADGHRLRWFTPVSEVDLCGHATLASAHGLWESGRLPAGQPARFATRSGLLTATRAEGGAIALDFPVTRPSPAPAPAGLFEALGLVEGAVFSNGLPQPDYLIVTQDTTRLRRLEPSYGGIRNLPVRGVIVTAPGDEPGIDFVSRFFAPAFGVDEDPVTGSAHCTLAPYWANRLGKSTMVGYQASKRGGRVGVRVRGDRVELTGRAVTVFKGTIQP